MALLSSLMGKGGSAEPARDLIKDGSTQTFMQDVIDASRDVPVIVDFWAPWCGPCKQLGPILERVVNNAGGKVRMVKINIDENPEIAQQLRIQSIPMVYAFHRGQPVDGFAGALPESQIKSFVERLIGPVGPGPVEQSLERASALLGAGQSREAAGLYEQILASEPDRPEALAGLARAQIGNGRLDRVPAEHRNHVEVDGARAALALAEEAGTLDDPAELNRRLEADENDHEARVDLATSLFLRGQVEPSIEHLLAIVRKDRDWNDSAARKRLVRFFEALGPSHPATVSGRRKLSAVLFS
jgi:putative thioredoxin